MDGNIQYILGSMHIFTDMLIKMYVYLAIFTHPYTDKYKFNNPKKTHVLIQKQILMHTHIIPQVALHQ